MEYDPKDNEVVHLLKKLKETNGTYPQEMLASRRQGYLRQVAEISGGAGLALGLRDAVKGGSGPTLPPAAGTIVEALLVVAIVAEAGAVAYFYRGKVTEFFQSLSTEPRVEQVANPPVLPSPIPEIMLTYTPSPVFTGTTTSTAVDTPTPQLAANPTQQNEGGSTSSTNGSSSGGSDEGGGTGSGGGGTTSSASTPDPNADNDDNGNHYGQTPKPDRTKEPGSDVSESNIQDNHTTPKKNR